MGEPAQPTVVWGGKVMREGKCPDPGNQCLACDRLGKHLEPVESQAEVELAEIRDLLVVSEQLALQGSTVAAVRAKISECEKWAFEVGRLRTVLADVQAILNRV